MRFLRLIRFCLLLPLLATTICTIAQTPKTLPGVFLYNVLSVSNDFKKSQSGNSVALKRGSYQFVLFDTQKGTITEIDRNLTTISSNHQYLFSNTKEFIRMGDWRDQMNAWKIVTTGISTDTVVRSLQIDYYAMDMDAKGNIIAMNVWYDSTNMNIKALKGLYLLDRVTGKQLKVFREDTLYIADRPNFFAPPLFLTKNHLVVGTNISKKQISIFPLNNAPSYNLPIHDQRNVFVDSSFVFSVGDSTDSYIIISAFDIRNGELVSRKAIRRFTPKGQNIDVVDNKLYILQADQQKIMEETPGKNGFETTRAWNLNPEVAIVKDQSRDFFAMKGPSFFIVPSDMKQAEANGVAGNTAWNFHALSNKVNFKVYPFYNRSPEEIARQEKQARDRKAYIDRKNAERDSIEHPERYCYKFWNTPKWKRGLTIYWAHAYYIMAEYDCKADKYKLWRPRQPYNGNGAEMPAQYVMVSGTEFRAEDYSTKKRYYTCTECGGDGTYDVTVYTTTTKDLPWGYFSGIETKKFTTTSQTIKNICKVCKGNGVALK